MIIHYAHKKIGKQLLMGTVLLLVSVIIFFFDKNSDNQSAWFAYFSFLLGVAYFLIYFHNLIRGIVVFKDDCMISQRIPKKEILYSDLEILQFIEDEYVFKSRNKMIAIDIEDIHKKDFEAFKTHFEQLKERLR